MAIPALDRLWPAELLIRAARRGLRARRALGLVPQRAGCSRSARTGLGRRILLVAFLGQTSDGSIICWS
ncbi:MAG: hypothetical protein ACRDRI_00880 [Pseudonocardiaceae bacterium]